MNYDPCLKLGPQSPGVAARLALHYVRQFYGADWKRVVEWTKGRDVTAATRWTKPLAAITGSRKGRAVIALHETTVSGRLGRCVLLITHAVPFNVRQAA
jgi:hypothetical protein